MAAVADAHIGTTIYPIYELPTVDLPDLRDGTLEDWEAVLPGSSLDHNSFAPLNVADGAGINPADLAYRVFMAWHSADNHIYAAIERIDDVYINTYEGGDLTGLWRFDSIEFMIDGDHSGGAYNGWGDLSDEERKLLSNFQAQQYIAIAESPDGRTLSYMGNGNDWVTLPPYADAGGFSVGESPNTSVIEMYVTPWDECNWQDPELSKPSVLEAGRIVGFQISIPDFDNRAAAYHGFHTLSGQSNTWREADNFVDGMLISCDVGDCQSPAPDTIDPAQTDTTSPTLISSFPADGAVVDPVELDQRGIVLTFSEPIDTTAMHFDLQVGETPVDWHVWAEEDSVLTAFRPRDQLTIGYGESYRISLTGLRDRNGNIASDLTLRFSTTQSSTLDTISPGIITTIAGGGHEHFSGDGGPATLASLNIPSAIAVDAIGQLFIADSNNYRIRKVDTNGIISTVAGNGHGPFSGDGGPATLASLNYPLAIAMDAIGQLFIADYGNNRIRKVDTNGIISTVAGNGKWGFSGDGGSATLANLNFPTNITVDTAGQLFIADGSNNRIRKVDTNGIISTVAGNGQKGFSGDDGSATLASLNFPTDITIDTAGQLFIADEGNRRIRKVDTNGIISTVAGGGHERFSGDGGSATLAGLNIPLAIAVDATGQIFIADGGNHRIRRVDTNGIISTVAGNGHEDFSGDGGPATQASLGSPTDIVVDTAGNLLFADEIRNRIRMVKGIATPTPLITGTSSFEPSSLHLVRSSPPDGAVGVDPDSLNNGFSRLILTFSEPADTTTMQIHLRADSLELDWPGQVLNDTTLHVFRPYGHPTSLEYGRTYELTVTGLRDHSLRLASDIRIHFTTRDSTVTPDSTDSTPTPDSTGTTPEPPPTIPPYLVEFIITPVKLPAGDTALLHFAFDGQIDLSATRIAVSAADLTIDWDYHSRGDSTFSLSFPIQPDLPLETPYQVVLAGLRDSTGMQLPDLRLSFPLPMGTDTEPVDPSRPVRSPSIAIDFDLADGDQQKRLLHTTLQQLDLQLVAADLPPINGWSATLEFDPDQLGYVPDSFQPSDFIPELVPLVNAPQEKGFIEVGGSVLGTSGSNSGDGILGHLVLEAVEGFTGRAEITITFLRLRPLSGDPHRSPVLSTATVVYVPLIAGLGLDFNPSPGDQLQTAVRSAAPGDRYPLQLHIRHAPEISGWSAVIEFDPDQLRYVPDSFQPSEFIPGLLSLAENRFPGRLSFGGSVLANATYSSGHGLLGTVEFEILEGFGDETELAVTELSLHSPSRETWKYRPGVSALLTRRLPPGITLDFDLAPGDQQERLTFQAAPGARYRLQLNLLDAPEIDGWSATLEFDPDQLRYVPDSFQPSGFIPGLITLVDDREWQVILGGAVLGTGGRNSGSGSLGIVGFDILDSFQGQATLSATELSLHRTDGQVLKLRPFGAQAIFFFGDGSSATAVAGDDPDHLPRTTMLAPNYPNPFNRSTVVPFQLARPASVCIDLFDVRGQRITTLIDAFLPAGFHRFTWDGTSGQGQPVSAGVYLVRLQSGSHHQVRKIVLVK